jgi:WD40-like Beta Propeller Repeat
MRRAALFAAAALLFAACGTDGDVAPGTAVPAKRLVYTRALGKPQQAVWIGDVRGARMRRLARGGFGLVAPDGRTIAISRRTGIFTVDPDGRGERFIARGRPAAWLPDSRHLLAVQRQALVNIDLSDGSVDIIERREVGTWSISPDGKTLAYDVYLARPPSGECGFDIYSAQVDGSSKRRLTTGGRSSHPIWGAGSIAFAYRPTSTGCFKPRIWQMGIEGGQRAPVMRTLPNRFATLGRYGVRPFAWVSSSPLLLATIPTEWGAELTLVNRRSGRARVADLDPRPRREQPMYVDHASRDGRYVVGAGCGAELPCTIAIYSVATGRARELITGNVANPHWNR